MRITKVYTRTGDQGETALVGGTRVPKNHIRIASYGTVDELNSVLGLVQSFLNFGSQDPSTEELQNKDALKKFSADIARCQNHLFNIGADLATPAKHRWENMIRVGNTDIQWLEDKIDQMNESLPPLKDFIIPGGHPVEAFLHQARTVCRRAERDVLSLMQEESIEPDCMQYLNRLSDYLFVASRWIGNIHNSTEKTWKHLNV
jgi:cob(I)alamin adenosyltransferase